MRPMSKLLLALSSYLFACVLGGIVISEGSLHLRKLPLGHQQQISDQVRAKYHAELQEVSVEASDGILLKGWYIHPEHSNGNVVVLLHGITDNREGVAGYGELFLDHGYAVLLPDARAHGESGGTVATYGVDEADDLHRWVSWIYAEHAPSCVYGFGESYGASLLLQSLPLEPRFCAVIAESPFSTAREMSYERVSRPLHMGTWFGKTLGRPVIESARLYSKMKYGVDLLKPSPLFGVTHSAVPVFLIHGEKDHTISARHSEMIARAAPDHVSLWLVSNAGHTGAWAAAHEEFERRVLTWFQEHQKPELQPASLENEIQLQH